MGVKYSYSNLPLRSRPDPPEKVESGPHPPLTLRPFPSQLDTHATSVSPVLLNSRITPPLARVPESRPSRSSGSCPLHSRPLSSTRLTPSSRCSPDEPLSSQTVTWYRPDVTDLTVQGPPSLPTSSVPPSVQDVLHPSLPPRYLLGRASTTRTTLNVYPGVVSAPVLPGPGSVLLGNPVVT